MSQTDPARPTLGRGLKLAIMAAVLIAAGAILYVTIGSPFKPKGRDGLGAFATGSLAKLKTPAEALTAPAVAFTGPEGAPAHLTDFKGKVVVLNFWATWCAPCVKEMPTLARLQAAYAGKPLQVVALSQDSVKKLDDAKARIAANAPLSFYHDPEFAVLPKAGLPGEPGFPTTILYDKTGRMRAYVQGEADWSSPEAHALIDKVMTQ